MVSKTNGQVRGDNGSKLKAAEMEVVVAAVSAMAHL
jgi:hypothetical protein